MRLFELSLGLLLGLLIGVAGTTVAYRLSTPARPPAAVAIATHAVAAAPDPADFHVVRPMYHFPSTSGQYDEPAQSQAEGELQNRAWSRKQINGLTYYIVPLATQTAPQVAGTALSR
jgi:hypothetical protein